MTLPEGWTTFSIPIRAEGSTQNGRFFAIDNLGTAAQSGLVDPAKVEQAFRFDAATQRFREIITDTVTNNATQVSNDTPLRPTEAVLVKSSAAHDATLVVEDAQTNPPSRLLPDDWNLVGLALPLDQTTMDAKAALISVFLDSDGKVGYTIVVSPSINPDPFILTRPLVDQDLTTSRGYWVFMENDDVLAGFSTTPVKP